MKIGSAASFLWRVPKGKSGFSLILTKGIDSKIFLVVFWIVTSCFQSVFRIHDMYPFRTWWFVLFCFPTSFPQISQIIIGVTYICFAAVPGGFFDLPYYVPTITPGGYPFWAALFVSIAFDFLSGSPISNIPVPAPQLTFCVQRMEA